MTSVTWEESEAYLFWIVRTMTNVLSTVIVVEGYANYNNIVVCLAMFCRVLGL